MSTFDKANTAAMAVLSAALFAFGGKTLLEIGARDHGGHEKAGYALPMPKEGAGGAATAGAAAFSFANIVELLPKANADAGEDTFKKCAACHTNTKGGENKVGPNLWDIVGRPVGKHAGFAYSDSVKNKGGDWNWEALANYLHDPRGTIPGNKMAFAGLSDDNDLADMLAYLRKLNDTPPALPTK